jgi:hypothetical protein
MNRQVRARPADTYTVSNGSNDESRLIGAWTFRRRSQRLTVQQQRHEGGGFLLLVVEDGQPRSYTFSDFQRLVAFQSDMEAFLIRTGWLLDAFTPERRGGRDRRRMPRTEIDRRRWWTDPAT